MFKSGQIGGAECVGFGHYGDEIDPGAQALHDFDVQWFEGMTSGPDKIKACVNTKIDLGFSTGLLFLQHIRLVLVVQKFDDGHPRIAIVHVVTKTRGINNRQTH